MVVVSTQSSHLALIDTLMMAYAVEMVSAERVMSCINRFSSPEPLHSEALFQELPYDTEDAIVTWINKVHAGARKTLTIYQHVCVLQRRLCSTPSLGKMVASSWFAYISNAVHLKKRKKTLRGLTKCN